jgi:multidrug efflux pump subunit AcrB
MKHLLAFVINKPILNHIFLLFLLVMAIFSYRSIPKEIFPPSNLDAIVISGGYAGASSDVLDKMAVKPIEDELANLSSVEKSESSVKNGYFSITATIKDGEDVSSAMDDVKDIIAAKRADLPSDMDEPVAKIAKHAYPLVTIAIASKLPKIELLEIADRLKSELSSLKDLSEITIRGDVKEDLYITLDQKKLDAYMLSLSDVVSALKSLSSIYPIGLINETGNHIYLKSQSGQNSAQAFADLQISIGAKNYFLKDISTVKFALQEASEISHYNGVENISININKSKEGNSIALAKQIREILKKYESKYQNVRIEVYTDTSIWIRNRLNTVISNIVFGLILVSLSVFVFVSGRIAFVVGIGIPVSFMIGLLAADWMGYSLNMLSLLGALIALGMLVDEAIVVAENIYRHIEEGHSPTEAAINGALEMFPAVLTATVTTIAAFIPLLMISGEMGVFIRILPIMISILLFSSLIEAFFFLPLHAKDFLKKGAHEAKSNWWQAHKEFYKRMLGFFLNHAKKMLFLFLLFIAAMDYYFISKSKFQLFPDFDNTEIYITGSVNINNDVTDTAKLVTQVEQKLLGQIDKSEISSITSISGFRLNEKYLPVVAENNFHIFISLYERQPLNFFDKYINPYLSPEYDDSNMKRLNSAKQIAKNIKELTDEFAKDTKRFEEFNVFVPGAGIVKSDIEISLIGDEMLIKSSLDALKKRSSTIEGISNLAFDIKGGEKELTFVINSYGQQLGLSEAYLSSVLRPLFFEMELGKMFKNGELVKIKSKELRKDHFESLQKMMINLPGSLKKVRLDEVATFVMSPNTSEIIKENSKRISTFYGTMDKTKITSSEYMQKISPLLEQFEQNGLVVDIKGEEKENKKVQSDIAKSGVIAIFLIFIALVWMFDSIVKSMLILSTIPLSVLGVFVGHEVMGLNLSMMALIGIVGLSGVIVNDGIIIIDFVKKAKSKEEFLKKASDRLRPVLLTSITTILGLFTLMFFASGQAVILQPMAITLGFGILWGTVLNLLYLPTLYYTIYKGKLA